MNTEPVLDLPFEPHQKEYLQGFFAGVADAVQDRGESVVPRGGGGRHAVGADRIVALLRGDPRRGDRALDG